MHYYQHHIGDFISDTAMLSDAHAMIYLRMLWIYYQNEQPLDNEIDAIAFKCRANASDVTQILKHFFFFHNKKWHHARCDKEILAFQEKSEKAKKSADARWKNADAMRTHSERNANEPVFDANHKPITNNQEPLKNIDAQTGDLSPQKEKPTRSPNGSRLPVDWEPSPADAEFLVTQRPDLVLHRVADDFRDYWHGVAGAKGRKADWPATWRGWVRRQNGVHQARASPNRPMTAVERRIQTAKEMYGYGTGGQSESTIIDIN